MMAVSPVEAASMIPFGSVKTVNADVPSASGVALANSLCWTLPYRLVLALSLSERVSGFHLPALTTSFEKTSTV